MKSEEDTATSETPGKRDEYKVSGRDLMGKVNEIIREGNARRIIIKNEKEETVVEFPLTIGAVGVVLAPVLAAVGALTALLTNCTIVVERRQ